MFPGCSGLMRPARIRSSGARRVATVPIRGVALPSLLWMGTARGDPLTTEEIRGLEAVAEQVAGVLDREEPPDVELARLRRFAVVEDVLATLIGVLDVREVFVISTRFDTALTQRPYPRYPRPISRYPTHDP